MNQFRERIIILSVTVLYRSRDEFSVSLKIVILLFEPGISDVYELILFPGHPVVQGSMFQRAMRRHTTSFILNFDVRRIKVLEIKILKYL